MMHDDDHDRLGPGDSPRETAARNGRVSGKRSLPYEYIHTHTDTQREDEQRREIWREERQRLEDAGAIPSVKLRRLMMVMFYDQVDQVLSDGRRHDANDVLLIACRESDVSKAKGKEFLELETAEGGCYSLSRPEEDGTRTLEVRE